MIIQFKRQSLLPLLLSLMALALSSCKQDPPIKQPPGGDTIPSAPTGLPDWSDTQYNWIRTRDTLCSQRDISGDYWSPKFGFGVMDASPDGKRVLLSMSGRVAIYDTTTHSLHTVFPFGCEYLAWSHDGRRIAGISNYPSLQQSVALYVIAADQWQFLPLPDTATEVNPALRWMPGDSALLLSINFVKTRGYHTLQIHDPYKVAPSPLMLEDLFTRERVIAIPGPDYSILRVAPLADPLVWQSYSMPGVLRADNERVSSDGNWLAFRMEADTRGTRFNSQFKVTALGIVDLRPGSPTQYQLYRVFPDYTNAYRNCSAAWFFSGVAWSGDGAYVYHEQIRMSDSTTQIVRRNVRTGKVEEITNFLVAP